MNTLDNIAVRIIKEQELVIGPLAWTEAGKVIGLHIIDSTKGEVELENANPMDEVEQDVAVSCD